MKSNFRFGPTRRIVIGMVACLSTVASTRAGTVPVPQQAAGWWRADGNANDVLALGNGMVRGSTTFIQGKAGLAFLFNGDDDGVIIPHRDELNVQPGGFTVEFWMKGGATQETQFLVVDKSHGFTDQTGWLFQGRNSNKNIEFGIGTGSSFPVVTSMVDVIDDAWHHVAGTWDGAMIRIYVDGTERDSLATTAVAGNTRDVHLGYAWGGGTPTRFFRGLVDELTYYTRALSGEEIAGIFNAGSDGKLPDCVPLVPGAKTWLQAEGDARDILSGNDGLLGNGTTFGPGMVGQAFSFDGTDDYVEIPDAGTAPGQQAFSIETWFKFNSFPDSQTQVVFTDGVTETSTYSFWYSSGNGQLAAHLSLDGGGTSFLLGAFNDTSRFHHFALTYDGVSILAYLDGAEVQNTMLPGTLADSTSPLLIGRSTLGSDHSLSGMVDELTIYSVTLSAADVQRIYLAGTAGKCLPVPGLIDMTTLAYAGGDFAFQVQGAEGHRYAIDASTNLVEWTELTVETVSGGVIGFSEMDVASFLRRFYRARFVP